MSDLETLSAQLSSMQNLTDDLSGLQVNFEQLLSAIQTLQEIPVHPYERLKYDMFGKDYNFLTIDDLSASEDFDVERCIEQIKSSTENINQSTQQSLSGLETLIKDYTTNPSVTSLEELIKKQELEKNVTDEDMTRKNILFSEAVQSITFEDIETRPEEISKRLLSYYTKLYNI